MSDPPTIAVTMHEAASLVFSPSPRMAKAKWVGYMIDMKKKLNTSAATETELRSTSRCADLPAYSLAFCTVSSEKISFKRGGSA